MCENVGGCEAGLPLLTWAKDDLAANPKTYVRLPTGTVPCSTQSRTETKKMKATWNVLYAAKIHIVRRYHKPNSEVRNSDTHGVLKLISNLNSYDLGFSTLGSLPPGGFHKRDRQSSAYGMGRTPRYSPIRSRQR